MLFPAAVMEATGLAALAETYALKREELTQLRILSERFFDGLRAAFATFTARPPTMLDAGLRVESYAAFTARLGAGALAVAVEVNLQTVAVLALTEQLARALVDDLFSREVPAPTTPGDAARPLTALETAVLFDTLNTATLDGFNRGLGELFGAEGRAVRLQSDGSLPAAGASAPVAPQERVAALVAQCTLGLLREPLGLALPLPALMGVRGRLPACQPGLKKETAPALAIVGASTKTRIELHAVLATVTLPLGDLAGLRPGSMLVLNRAQQAPMPVELACNGHPVFYGTVVEDRGWRKFLVREKAWQNGSTATHP